MSRDASGSVLDKARVTEHQFQQILRSITPPEGRTGVRAPIKKVGADARTGD